MRKWIDPKPHYGYRDTFAWRPVRAYDEYSGRMAWVWLQGIRVFDDGRVTFSSFWC